MSVADLLAELLGTDLPVACRRTTAAGSGPPDAPATLVVRSPDALRRHRHRSGRARLRPRVRRRRPRRRRRHLRRARARATASRSSRCGGASSGCDALRIVGLAGLRPLAAAARGGATPRPAASAGARRRGDRAPLRRVERLLPARARAVDDLLVRGVVERRTSTLEAAQAAKYELDLPQARRCEPGMRLLDVGCGWGGMVLHAAQHHGVRAVGVTLSRRAGRARAEARRRGRARRPGRDPAAGLPRRQRRSVRRDQLDRHVRARRARRSSTSTSDRLLELLRPEGRLLNHAISRPARGTGRPRSRFTPTWRSSTATCSPTASCTRSGRVVSRDAAGRASRSATSRACASTTR